MTVFDGTRLGWIAILMIMRVERGIGYGIGNEQNPRIRNESVILRDISIPDGNLQNQPPDLRARGARLSRMPNRWMATAQPK